MISERNIAMAPVLALIALMILPSMETRAADIRPGAAKPSASSTREQLAIDPTAIMKPWRGDLNGLVERRLIRVLTTYSKTFYFLDKATQHGITHDVFRVFETEFNKQLVAQKKLKQKQPKVRVVLIPIRRDELLPALAAGKGDIAAANLTITPERQEMVEFASPVYSNVSEVVVSGPSSPSIDKLDDLAGKEIFVRKSSSYYASVLQLNKQFTSVQESSGGAQRGPGNIGRRGSPGNA
jgi:ABC-type amino acid transport substrate-binding protein